MYVMNARTREDRHSVDELEKRAKEKTNKERERERTYLKVMGNGSNNIRLMHRLLAAYKPHGNEI